MPNLCPRRTRICPMMVITNNPSIDQGANDAQVLARRKRSRCSGMTPANPFCSLEVSSRLGRFTNPGHDVKFFLGHSGRQLAVR